MSLQNLIKNNRLERIPKGTIEEVNRRFSKGVKFFNQARLFYKSTNDEEFVYKNVFDAARKIADSLLFLEGYRTKGRDHHKNTIEAVRLLIKDDELLK